MQGQTSVRGCKGTGACSRGNLMPRRCRGRKSLSCEFDAETLINSADLTGAPCDTDLSPLNISAEQLNTAFGDGSVTLPDHIDWPAHWPRESVDYDEFEKQWRAFLATLPPGWDAPKR